MPLFVDKFDFPLSIYPYLCTGARPVEMCPIVTAPQYRRVYPHRDDNMSWGIVGKISLMVDRYSSQGRIQCGPSYRGQEHVWPGVLSFSDSGRSRIKIQQAFKVTRRNALRPAKRHQQRSVFSTISTHGSQCRLRPPILSIGGIDQLIANVIIKRLHLLADSTFALRKFICKHYNLWISGFDMQFGLDKIVQKFPL